MCGSIGGHVAATVVAVLSGTEWREGGGCVGGTRCSWTHGCCVSFLDHQVDRHLSLQTRDVTLTEVVAQLVHLKQKYKMFTVYCYQMFI